MTNSSCAVIGGSGFIGGHLVQALVAQGRTVLSIARSACADRPGARHVRVDMTDADGLARALTGVGTVYHLGATVPSATVNAPAVVRQGNRKGAAAVVAACRTAGVASLVYVTGHLGMPRGGPPVDLAFLEGKVAAEEIILAAGGDGLATCSVRAPVVFGPGDKVTGPFVRGEMAPVPGFPCTFAFIYVDDLVPLLVRAADKLAERSPRVVGEAIEVEGERMTLQSFLALPAWGKPPPRVIPYRIVRALAVLNAWCARKVGAAPLGEALCPQVLDSMALHERHEGGRTAVEALEIAVESPRSVEDAIRHLVARHKEPLHAGGIA